MRKAPLLSWMFLVYRACLKRLSSLLMKTGFSRQPGRRKVRRTSTNNSAERCEIILPPPKRILYFLFNLNIGTVARELERCDRLSIKIQFVCFEISWNVSESVHLPSLSFNENSRNVRASSRVEETIERFRTQIQIDSRNSMMAEEKVGSGIQSFSSQCVVDWGDEHLMTH